MEDKKKIPNCSSSLHRNSDETSTDFSTNENQDALDLTNKLDKTENFISHGVTNTQSNNLKIGTEENSDKPCSYILQSSPPLMEVNNNSSLYKIQATLETSYEIKAINLMTDEKQLVSMAKSFGANLDSEKELLENFQDYRNTLRNTNLSSSSAIKVTKEKSRNNSVAILPVGIKNQKLTVLGTKPHKRFGNPFLNVKQNISARKHTLIGNKQLKKHPQKNQQTSRFTQTEFYLKDSHSLVKHGYNRGYTDQQCSTDLLSQLRSLQHEQQDSQLNHQDLTFSKHLKQQNIVSKRELKKSLEPLINGLNDLSNRLDKYESSSKQNVSKESMVDKNSELVDIDSTNDSNNESDYCQCPDTAMSPSIRRNNGEDIIPRQHSAEGVFPSLPLPVMLPCFYHPVLPFGLPSHEQDQSFNNYSDIRGDMLFGAPPTDTFPHPHERHNSQQYLYEEDFLNQQQADQSQLMETQPVLHGIDTQQTNCQLLNEPLSSHFSSNQQHPLQYNLLQPPPYHLLLNRQQQNEQFSNLQEQNEYQSSLSQQ